MKDHSAISHFHALDKQQQIVGKLLRSAVRLSDEVKKPLRE